MGLSELGCGVAGLVGVEAPLSLPLLPWNADPPQPTGVGRKAMGRITALPCNKVFPEFWTNFIHSLISNLNVRDPADRCDHGRLTVELIDVLVDRDGGAGGARGSGGRARRFGQTEPRAGEAGGGRLRSSAADRSDAGVDIVNIQCN